MATRKKIPLIDSSADLAVTGSVAIAGSGSAVITFPSVTSTLITTANIEDSIVDGHTTIAPSGNAVFDALALKLNISSAREVLTADRTYYVRTDGNDSNNGLANTSGGAFLTIQKALDVCTTIDFNGKTVTISIGAGTFSSQVVIPRMTGQSGVGNLILNGAGSSTILTYNGDFAGTITLNTVGAMVTIQNLKIQNTSASYGIGIRADYASQIFIGGGIEFGSIVYADILCTSNAFVGSRGFTVSSNVQYIFWCQGGKIILDSGTYAFGTRTVTTTAFSEQLGYISSNNVTYTGTVTGKRYEATFNSIVNGFGGGANVFPGSVAGTTATGGQYS